MIQKRNLNATEDNSVAPELEREALTRLRSGNGIYCTSTTFEEFYLIFAAKSLVSIWPKTWERAPGWLKRGLAAAERSSSEATGLQRLLVVLEGAGEPVEDQPSLGTSSLRRSVRGRPSPQRASRPHPERGPPGSGTGGGWPGQNSGHAGPEGPGSGSSPRERQLPQRPGVSSTRRERLPPVLEEGTATGLVLHVI